MESKAVTRLYGMLGFAMRAGKVIIGTELVCSSLPRRGNGSVELVLISASASQGTKKKMYTKCKFYGKELREIAVDGDELGRLLGKTFAPMVVALSDPGFATEIRKALDSMEEGALAKTERKEVSD